MGLQESKKKKLVLGILRNTKRCLHFMAKSTDFHKYGYWRHKRGSLFL